MEHVRWQVQNASIQRVANLFKPTESYSMGLTNEKHLEGCGVGQRKPLLQMEGIDAHKHLCIASVLTLPRPRFYQWCSVKVTIA